MKKVLQISMVIIWMLSISGVVVSKHYCGPFLKKIELGHAQGHCTDMDEADMPADCCKNTTEFQSLDGDFLKIDKLQQVSPNFLILYSLDLPTSLVLLETCGNKLYEADDSSGPPIPSSPLFIENRVLII